MKKRILLLLLVSAISAAAQPAPAAPGAHVPVLPLAPADFITYQPPVPTGWILLTSVASNSFNDGWVTAFAVRTFKKIPPPPLPGAPPAPPVTMNMFLIDSGYKTDYSGEVTAPKTGAPSGTTYLQIKDYPARMIKPNDTTTDLAFVVNDRFRVEIRTVNLPDDKLKTLAESLDFSKLKTIPDTGQTSITDPVIISRVDELNSQNNHTYPLFWNGASINSH